MKITIEWTTTEIKEFLWDRNRKIDWVMECKETLGSTVTENEINDIEQQEMENVQEEKKDWIFYSDKWITFRYQGKKFVISNKNVGAEKEMDYGSLLTYDEAVKYCKKLRTMYLPSIEERAELFKARCGYKWYGYNTNNWLPYKYQDNIGKEFAEDFKLPLAGFRNVNASVNGQGSQGRYWSSSPSGTYSYYLHFDSSDVYLSYGGYRAHARSVRCFKNSYGD